MSGKEKNSPSEFPLDPLEEPVPPSRNPTAPPPFDPQQYARESESRLRAAEVANPTRRITNVLELVPSLKVASADLEWFDFTDLQSALVPFVDGEHSVASIVKRCGRPELEVMRGLLELAQLGVIILPKT
jgi:hypothetical protein